MVAYGTAVNLVSSIASMLPIDCYTGTGQVQLRWLMAAPALLNGTEATIQAGDQIQIGGYLLLVEPAAAAASMTSAPSQAASPFGAPAPALAPKIGRAHV